MLAIRLTRTGRKGHAQYRLIVQEARLTPTSGRIVAPLGSYNPHTKVAAIDKDKAVFYLEHGAQPSDRVVKLLKAEGVALPKWLKVEKAKVRAIRNPDKLRRNRPKEETPTETQPDPPSVAEETAASEAPAPQTEKTDATLEETEAASNTSTEESEPVVSEIDTEEKA